MRFIAAALVVALALPARASDYDKVPPPPSENPEPASPIAAPDDSLSRAPIPVFAGDCVPVDGVFLTVDRAAFIASRCRAIAEENVRLHALAFNPVHADQGSSGSTVALATFVGFAVGIVATLAIMANKDAEPSESLDVVSTP
jgi:hypothetical protein